MKRIKDFFAVLFFTLAALLASICGWVKSTFNVSLNAIINTILSSLQGTSSDTVNAALQFCLPWIIGVFVIAILFVVTNARKKDEKKAEKRRNIMLLTGVVALVLACACVQLSFDVIGYIFNRNAETGIYTEEYVDPRSVEITPKGKKRNLIYIYLESMETTYADTANGGAQEENYIPNLTALAKENISFSNKAEGLGGFNATDGTGWTMGAMFATTAGIPFELPVGNNDMDKQEKFASGVYNLGDFLRDQGYKQEFLCGSDAVFGGRKLYMTQHGDYEIFDYFTARERGYIPEDYKVWWGYEDEVLFEIARDEVTRLAAGEEPFNFTMLTVDTHHIGGYICDICGDAYENDTANVVACTDAQVGAFVEWCKQQDFYENTTIVITGDHPRMDNNLVAGIGYNDRTLYNCFINSVYVEEPVTTGRVSTTMDMFPTVVSALGYEIEGHRLAMGTDLFSGQQTLVEKMGDVNALNAELMKSSRFYIETFAPELLHLIEDEFDSLCTVCFYGSDYNANQYLPAEQVAPQGIASWLIGQSVDVKIPIEKRRKVTVRIHVQEVYNKKQKYRIVQDGEVIAKGKVKGTDIIEFEAVVKDGVCSFIMELPNAVSPHELNETNPDERQLSLLVTSLTVNKK